MGEQPHQTFPGDVPWGRHDNVGTIFWGTSPLKIWEGKNRPKFGAILRNFTFRSQISPERMKISTSGERRYQLESLPRWAKTFGELWSTNYRAYAANVYRPKFNLFEMLYLGP